VFWLPVAGLVKECKDKRQLLNTLGEGRLERWELDPWVTYYAVI